MAIITTPGAGVSPYEPTTDAPTVLRAGADGTTVSTSTAAAAATVSELAATNANTLVVVSGQAALNSLITSNQPGVFQGANVNITLEEQNFNTTNQVTSTINSPSGNIGEIQYNSGANSFTSSPYFTYNNSNVITPGIRTDNYLYANGQAFTGSGSGNGQVGGSNTQIQFNDSGNFSGATGFTFNKTSNVLNVPGNVSATYFSGNGSQLANITGANVSGEVSFAATANAVAGANVSGEVANASIAGTVYTNAQPNITSVGILSSLEVTGNISNANVITANTFTLTSGNLSIVNSVAGSTYSGIQSTDNIPLSISTSNTNGVLEVGWLADTANVSAGFALITANPSSSTGNVVISGIEPGGVEASWIFDPFADGTGNTVFPTGMHITSDGAGGTRMSLNSNVANIGLRISAGNTNAFTSIGWSESEIPGTGTVAAIAFNTPVSRGNAQIITGNLSAVNYRWTFNDSGNLDLPGNLILPGNITGTGASPAPSINGFDTINSITVSASGNITGNNLAATNLVINSITSDDSTFVTIEDGVNVNGEILATGNITGNYFIGNGSQLTSVAIPSQTILPTIQTITAVASPAGLFGGGQGGANVTVANTIPVTEYGVIITAGTTSETFKTGALGSIPGTVSLTFSTGLNSTQYTLYAYVTSNAGTYYSDAVTGTSGICLLAGTQIALSDGTHKAIEDITYTDKLLSWDFDRGCYAETTAVWIKRSETGSQYNLLTFSDGTTLRTFDQHRIFNKQAGAFTYPMTAATPIGTVTVNEHGQEITLANKQVIQDTIEYYNVITDYHMNLFSDSVLTSCRFNNIYPITDMKFVKDNRTLRTRAEFENVPDRFFHGLRLAEQTTEIETVEWYVDRLLSTEVSTHAELAV
jgi:hypothetical protein